MFDDDKIVLPADWVPLTHQIKAWRWLETPSEGKRTILIWHRRSGKDAVSLNYTALAASQKPATYWYLLPMQRQARRTIWDAVDPVTGRRRIDMAFPKKLRAKYHEQEMSIELTNGSMIHFLGSDNYDSLVGSPPYGVVYSEWALAKPASWGYIRPILRQNGGWATFITTPRGRNHAYTMFEAAKKYPERWFAQRLTALETNVFTQEGLDEEYRDYINDFGIEDGSALFAQEYLCSFESAIRGSYWGADVIRAEEDGRILDDLRPLRGLPVHTVWDIGVDNATAIWFFQVTPNEVRWLNYYEQVGMSVEHFAEYKWRIGEERGYSYEGSIDYVPHDSKQRSWTSSNADGTARQRLEDMRACKLNPQLVPNHHRADGIYAAKKTIARSFFHGVHCKEGLECLRNYQREWDADNRIYAKTPLHNWATNGADAFRYGAIAWRGVTKPKPAEKDKVVVYADKRGEMKTGLTFEELRNRNAKKTTANMDIAPHAARMTFLEARKRQAKRSKAA